MKNEGEWKNKEKLKLVQVNREEIQEGKNFMKRIKQQSGIELPQKKTSSKLNWQWKTVLKRIFRTKSRYQFTSPKNMDWFTEITIKLVKIDDEERSKGRRFMDQLMRVGS